MTDSLQKLVAALREELQSYGALLAQLDQQQDYVVARASEALLSSIESIQLQAAELQAARGFRDQCRHAVARELGLPQETPFAMLIPVLPADYQPLLEALVQENNELLIRVQQRARQNHLLLSRSVELLQQFIGSLLPGQDNPTYSGSGRSRGGVLPASAVFDAVG